MARTEWADAATSALALWREFATAAAPVAKRHGLSPEQVATLIAVANVGDGEMSGAEFGRISGLCDRRARQTAYGALEGERKGGKSRVALVKIERDPEDRRGRRISLTTAGHEVLREITKATAARIDDDKAARLREHAEQVDYMSVLARGDE